MGRYSILVRGLRWRRFIIRTSVSFGLAIRGSWSSTNGLTYSVSCRFSVGLFRCGSLPPNGIRIVDAYGPHRRASDDGWEEVTQGRSFDGLSVEQGRFQASSQVLVRRAPHSIPPTRMDFCCAVDRQAPILTKPFNLLRMRIVMITTITAFATISPTSSPRYVLPHLYSPLSVNPPFSCFS